MQTVTESRFLGISAKSSNAAQGKKLNPDALLQSRRWKYELQRTAQTLLYQPDAHKQHRVCGCHRNVASDGVSIHGAVDGSDARYGNLITCGSVWSCPVCAGKITEGRRVDMQKAQSKWLLDGGVCLLMTLTYPHENDLPLAESLEKFGKALDKYKNSRTYKRIFGTSIAQINQAIDKGKVLKNVKQGEFQRLGTVRSLEVTHGVNGWHPHVHEVLFMQDEKLMKNERALDELKHAWVEALLKSGLGSKTEINHMIQHGLDIRGGDYVSDYINKFGREPLAVKGWTIAHEVTKANSKHGKNAKMINDQAHFTPFQLLSMAAQGDHVSIGLFKEFSQCFEGKRQNYWTNGLKDWFKIDEVDDQDAAAAEIDQVETEVIMRLDTDQWKVIISHNARFEILQAAAAAGKDGVLDLLDKLANMPKSHGGFFLDRARPDFNRFFQ